VLRTVSARSARTDVVVWAAAILCATFTLWWSLAEKPPGRTLFSGVDKVEHAIAYLATALLFLMAAVWRPGRGDGPFARRAVWVVLGLVVAGGAVEVVQSSIGRDAELGDWAAEVVAIALAWTILTVWRIVEGDRSGRSA
jgi:VanZ family protein